jgi:transcriptional regulator GlxA family with amidase domain
MDIAVLAVAGLFDSGLSAVLDVLGTANALREQVVSAPAPFTVTTVGPRRCVRTGNGHLVSTVPWSGIESVPDLVVLPALGVKSPEQVVEVVRAPANAGTLAVVRDARARGAALAAACTGTFFLAESGALDGLAATTSWWLGPAFRRRYPRVRLDETRTLIHDGGITTAGAAFAHIDLALSVVQRHSPALADLVARYLLIGDRPSQAAFAIPALLATANPTMSAFERWVREHLSQPLPVAEAARALGVSERTLQRTCTAVVGMTPIDFIQEIRLDEATFLLRTTTLSVDAVAARVGYRNVGTLRALVRRRRGGTLAALRQAGSPAR